jgi:virulence factor
VKVGIIGLGDIACKTYLPVITTRNVELHLCSRDREKLSRLGSQYRISNTHNDIDSLISGGIEAAFVHTATSSHEEIVQRLLEKNIHVYVDKPVTDSYESTSKLVSLARSKGLILKAGFNRRYAPAYANLKSIARPNMIIMQKNRMKLPGEIRTFVFDDFIHVVDTLLFLMNNKPTEKISISSRGSLEHLVVTFQGADITAIGTMNRDSGVTEERLEIFSSEEKHVVLNLTDTFIYRNKAEIKPLRDPWQSTLKVRGFEDIIDDFLKGSNPDYDSTLLTHQICETIVSQLEKQKLQ